MRLSTLLERTEKLQASRRLGSPTNRLLRRCRRQLLRRLAYAYPCVSLMSAAEYNSLMRWEELLERAEGRTRTTRSKETVK